MITLYLCGAPANAQENGTASAPVLTLPTVDIQSARPAPARSQSRVGSDQEDRAFSGRVGLGYVFDIGIATYAA
jgi:hypothetical protein